MNDRTRGIAIMFLSVIGFVCVQTLVKFIGPSVFGWTKAFYRSVFGLAFLLAWKLINKSGFRITNIPLLLLRGTVGGFALSFSFLAIDMVDLSRSTLYLYMFPIFAPVFSVVFFREKLTLRTIITLVIAIIGVVLVSDIKTLDFTLGDIIGISSGLLAGVAIATVRELRKTDTPEDIYLGFLVVSLVVCGIGVSVSPGEGWKVPLDSHFPEWLVWVLLVLIGGAATMGQLFMTYAYRVLTTATGSQISLLVMPIVTAIAIIFFGEESHPATIVGGILIFGSAIVSSKISDTRSD
jgi:drug/metabolite transporter (DMT)-like permease